MGGHMDRNSSRYKSIIGNVGEHEPKLLPVLLRRIHWKILHKLLALLIQIYLS